MKKSLLTLTLAATLSTTIVHAGGDLFDGVEKTIFYTKEKAKYEKEIGEAPYDKDAGGIFENEFGGCVKREDGKFDYRPKCKHKERFRQNVIGQLKSELGRSVTLDIAAFALGTGVTYYFTQRLENDLEKALLSRNLSEKVSYRLAKAARLGVSAAAGALSAALTHHWFTPKETREKAGLARTLIWQNFFKKDAKNNK